MTASVAVFVWAVVGLIWPTWARLPSRAASVGVWVLSVVLFMIGGALMPDSTPEQTEQSAALGSQSESAPSSVSLRIAVSDDTEHTPTPERTEVWVRGEGSWFPDITFGGDARDFSGLEIGTSETIFFYPLGRDEPEIQVLVPITSQLCPQGCARDLVMLDIYDDRFEVWAPGGTQETFPRCTPSPSRASDTARRPYP